MPQPFEWEDRYLVIKRSHLDPFQARRLQEFMEAMHIPTVGAVVVEEDWPEYEPTKDLIKTRVLREENELLKTM